jgi:hypothetical protein
MRLPGFTAETSLYKTMNNYGGSAKTEQAAGLIEPASSIAQLFQPSFRHVDLFSNQTLTGIGNHFPPPLFTCGGLGDSCCWAPIQNLPAYGPLVSCDIGLGCDIAANKCVANCGGPGQVCCDGPETRALKWTADGKVYSPTSPFLVNMCGQGACDKQSHTCFTCGMNDGDPCCPPDASQATAFCRGANLTCQYDPVGLYTSGTCLACGIKDRRPCDWGCQPGLGIHNGFCDICGGDTEPPCDNGCNSGLGLLKGLCSQCGRAGQVPCDNGCTGFLRPRNGVCAVCGGGGQPPCDTGCNAGTTLMNGVCTLCGGNGQVPCATGCNTGTVLIHGVCTTCGGQGQVPCANSSCRYPLKIAKGSCQLCGANGQIPCDTGCDQGLMVQNTGLCGQPPPQGADTCAHEGQSCVAGSVPGMHCCTTDATPLLCVYGQCKACVPHGDECKLYGPQLCCSWTDTCSLDQYSGKAVCQIPDAGDPSGG